MKYLLCLISVLMFAASGEAQQNDTYYWYKGEKQPLEVKEDKWFLLFNHQPERHVISRELKVNEEKIEETKKLHRPADTDQYWTVVQAERGELNLNTTLISYYAPYFYSESGKEVGLSDLFYVKLHEENDNILLKTMADEYGVKIVSQNRFMPLWFTLAVDRHSAGNALEMANLFYESGYFSAAEPDLMEDMLIQSVNDPFFGDQWNLLNTGQYGGAAGNDIQAVDAWQITRSHSGLILAVLDHGLEMDHPDMPNIELQSYDTNTDSSPSLVRGNHGVAVAGIAGANTDNNEGVAGIAPQGILMSISNSLVIYPGVMQDLANGINFAWQNGGDIINNSWGSDALQSQQIDDAIANAVTQGRDGLGTVVVFATGNNNNNAISYPSTDPNVIAVGAVSMCEERTSPTSCDTEDIWGSHFGAGLDVVAPGVLIPTTDRQPPNGYNRDQNPRHLHIEAGGTLLDENNEYGNQNYTIWFNGTSAAAPHVAGIASLILSINDNLTLQEVRDAIESTAEKIGNYTYTMGAGERQDLTWNNEMGYGRVNAYEALLFTIENHGAHLGTEMSQVRLPLYDDLTLQEDVSLESGSNLTIESESGTVTIAAASGTVTIGGPGGASKIAGSSASEEDGSGGGNENTNQPETIPEEFSLSQNYPNPFNPATVISYELPAASDVTLEVFDMLGRRVAVLVDGAVSAGWHQVQFDASSLSSGLYIYRIRANNFVQTRQMTLIK